MEFESMDSYFPTVRDDSETTCNVPWTRGPMAPTELNRERCRSSRHSTATASTAATTSPFQNHPFDTISAPYGLSLRKLLSGSVALPVVAATTGVIAWSGHLVTIPLSVVAPLLVYRAKSRTHAYSMMFWYYAAASWLAPRSGSTCFLWTRGHAAYWSGSLSHCCCVARPALGLLFTQKRGKAAVAVPLYVLIAAIPPLLSAGVLFRARNGWVWPSSSSS